MHYDYFFKYFQLLKQEKKWKKILYDFFQVFLKNVIFYEKLDQGYAIPERITVRFSDEQNNYLVKLFEQGESDNTKRARVEAVEKGMILKFPLNLVLEEGQIDSYFSKQFWGLIPNKVSKNIRIAIRRDIQAEK